MTTGYNGKFVLVGEISAALSLVMASCGKESRPSRIVPGIVGNLLIDYCTTVDCRL